MTARRRRALQLPRSEPPLKEVVIVQLTGSHHPFGHREHGRLWTTMSDTFWLLVLAAIGLFAFFLALGAFGPGDVAGLTIAVGILVVLWIAHSVRARKLDDGRRDAATLAARERRGF
jgi:hypothetical protein